MGKRGQFPQHGYLYAALVFCISTGVNSQIIVKIGNVGDSSTIRCDLLNAQWYKNGTKLDETPKVKPTDSSLHIFCLELSDNGIYECRNESNTHQPRNYNLTVKNP
ncbi:fibroblast growth factor receptor homolog 1-like isoform X1, partial [Paramuricea clavata]